MKFKYFQTTFIVRKSSLLHFNLFVCLSIGLSASLSISFLSPSLPFWAAAPKGRCPVGHRGEFPYVRTSVRKLMKNEKNVKFPLNNMATDEKMKKKRKTPIKYHGKLLQRPQICPLRTYGNSPLCPTGHRPFGAAPLLSLHFFS